MVGWHQWLNGHEFEQTPGDSEGQGSLAYFMGWQRVRCDLATRQEQKHKINYDDGSLYWGNMLSSEISRTVLSCIVVTSHMWL